MAAAAAAAATLARRTASSSSSLRLCCRPSLPSSIPSSSFRRPISSFYRASAVAAALSSMLPLHTATASSRSVSQLAGEANACVHARFANYLSPS